MWKDVLYYSKKEKRAVFVLIVLIVLLYFTSKMLPYFLRSEHDNIDLSLYKTEHPEFFEINEDNQTASENKMQHTEIRDIQLFKFDPNTIDSVSLIRLGLKPFQAKNILKYRRKGGKFKTPDDLSKIYGLDEYRFKQLKPFIHITNSGKNSDKTFPNKFDFEKNPSKKFNFEKQEKYTTGIITELNSADTVQLKKIPGIGSGFSKRITEYRSKLGGYYSVEQLKEVWGLTPEIYETIKPWFKISSENINKMPVNDLTIEQLVRHPYISYKQAKILVELRKKKGPLQSMKQLMLLEEFSEKDIERLSYYLNFDK
jgi:DNA uptake protein ComE-like DNA-binding protein